MKRGDYVYMALGAEAVHPAGGWLRIHHCERGVTTHRSIVVHATLAGSAGQRSAGGAAVGNSGNCRAVTTATTADVGRGYGVRGCRIYGSGSNEHGKADPVGLDCSRYRQHIYNLYSI